MRVSIVLKVKESTKIRSKIIIKALLLIKIISKKARSGITLSFNEIDIMPENPSQNTTKKTIIDELIKLFSKLNYF